MNFVNLNIFSLLPINCKFHYNFIDKLILTTISPIVAVIVLILCYVIHRFFIICRLHHHAFDKNDNKYNADNCNVDHNSLNDEHGIHSNNNRK